LYKSPSKIFLISDFGIFFTKNWIKSGIKKILDRLLREFYYLEIALYYCQSVRPEFPRDEWQFAIDIDAKILLKKRVNWKEVFYPLSSSSC